jgi:hypothetical protein
MPLAGRSWLDESGCHAGYTGHFSRVGTYSRLRTGTRTEGRTHGGQHHEGTSPPWLPQLDQSWPAQEVGSLAVRPRLPRVTSIAVRVPVLRCGMRTSGGDDGFKPGRYGPDAPPLAPASARPRLRLRERAGRLARDTVGPLWISSWLRPGEGGADCAEPSPQRPARSASRSPRPLSQVYRWALIVAVSCGYVWRGRGDRE